jgi:hypothetical protein
VDEQRDIRNSPRDKSLNQVNAVQVYAKRDAANMKNYRQNSLLQTAYAILAAMTNNRLLTGLDSWITSTQYGFRPKDPQRTRYF